MKMKFLKKKFIFVILSLFILSILNGCSSNKSITTSQDEKNSSISQNKKEEISKDSSKEEVNSNETSEEYKKDEDNKDIKNNGDGKNNVDNKNSKDSTSPKLDKVSGKVKLYEGVYFDDRRFGENSLKTYCEVVISNIKDTSFDFTIYEVNSETEERKVIFLKNTANFIGDGTKAAFYGKDYTLNFTFPNNHRAYPVVTDMNISGFKPVEGKTYVNNGIPGHEFG